MEHKAKKRKRPKQKRKPQLSQEEPSTSEQARVQEEEEDEDQEPRPEGASAVGLGAAEDAPEKEPEPKTEENIEVSQPAPQKKNKKGKSQSAEQKSKEQSQSSKKKRARQAKRESLDKEQAKEEPSDVPQAEEVPEEEEEEEEEDETYYTSHERKINQGKTQFSQKSQKQKGKHEKTLSEQDIKQKHFKTAPRDGTEADYPKAAQEPEPSDSGLKVIEENKEKDFTVFNEGSVKIIDQRTRRDKIRVATNYFKLRLSDFNMKVYHYDVAFHPDKPRHLLRRAWEEFNSIHFPKSCTAFDGRKSVYSKGPLIDGKTLHGIVTILNNERNKDKEFSITITEVRQVCFSVLENYKGNLHKAPESEIHVLDNILREWPSRVLVQGDKNFFTEISNPLSDVLEIRQGIFQSAILGSKLLLNFDIAHKVFYRSIGVVNVYEHFQNKKYFNLKDINTFMKKVKVEYYPIDKSRGPQVYVFNELVDNARTQKFKIDDVSITVEDYFLEKMKYKIKYPQYPLLWVGSRNATVYLPMELCRIAKNQVNNSELEPYEQREMLKMTTFNARDRKLLTEKLFENTKFSNPVMKAFGITVSTEMEQVEGHVLKPPVLQTQRSIRTQNGVWDNTEFYKPKSLRKWCILNLDKYANREKIINLQNMIKKIGHECGMLIDSPDRNPEDVFPSSDKLRRAFSNLKGMDLVFVVISDKKEDYSKVKTISEIEKGILTQCIKRKTIDQDYRKISTTIKNILLKVNAKLGGENQTLDKSSMPESLRGYVMIVGADVTHPRPGSKMPSVAAVAVSYDSNASKYAISHRVQYNEIIKNFEEIMRFHIKQFNKIRGHYPDKILYFRDGVSEGQLKHILLEEVKAIEKACHNLCKSDLTVLVVQKRHHTRLYPTSSADAIGKNYNVPVGTCIDTEVVSPRNLDFYLVSHASLLGTARPTRYRLLRNDNHFSDYELEKLCYYLCYLCSRCTRSISYPSPTYYAHLGAFRAKSYLDEIIRPNDIIDVEKIQSKLTDEISPSYPMFFI